VLEVMACGTPGMTSDRAPLPESTGDAVLAVDLGNVEALAETMRRILTDQALIADL
jgi:glycosyltransferase involved in cell wall biosynthesis